MSRTHRILIGVVVAGAALIAAIGFAGSYTAVRDLAERKGFGAFSAVFPIGIDAGIVVLLALDLLLTWTRIPFPLLRQTAWLLTAATIAFNGAAAWPDPLGVGMHAVIPLLFVVAVEAARHAVGRIADLTADKHMEGVRLARWLLAFPSTFRLWRRMKLWELRSYDEVIKLEQDRLVYRTRLRARYGRAWRRRAPVEALMPLRLARYGVPLAETGAAGLAAAGISVPAPAAAPGARDAGTHASAAVREAHGPGTRIPAAVTEAPAPAPGAPAAPGPSVLDRPPTPEAAPEPAPGAAPEPPAPEPEATPAPETARTTVPQPAPTPQTTPEPTPEEAPTEHPPHDSRLTVPVGPGRKRPLGGTAGPLPVPEPRSAPAEPVPVPEPELEPAEPAPDDLGTGPAPTALPDDIPREEAYYGAFRQYVAEKNDFPDPRQFARYLQNMYGVTGREGGPLSENYLRSFVREFRQRFREEMETAEHIP
ncbi:membrane protein [Streptomyces griseoflavus]|nr:membrane protein [Streptomyces griseoflavus]